jgi:hypothetical protein
MKETGTAGGPNTALLTAVVSGLPGGYRTNGTFSTLATTVVEFYGVQYLNAWYRYLITIMAMFSETATRLSVSQCVASGINTFVTLTL